MANNYKINPSKALTKGFTLMELLIVIAIIGTISALVMPSFSPPNNNGQQELLAIKDYIETQRNTIINNGEPQRLEISLKNGELNLFKIFLTKDEKSKKLVPTSEFSTSIVGYNLIIANAIDSNEDGEIILSPDGTISPFMLRKSIDNSEKWLSLYYSGTAAIGKIKVDKQ